MRKEELSDAMGYIDDELIEAANEVRKEAQGRRYRKEKTGSKKAGAWKWLVVAASIALVVYLGYEGFPPKSSEALPELPMLSVTEDYGEGMGIGAVWAYDVSELINANPWSEDLELTTLPVYKNTIEVGDGYRPMGGDFDAMTAYLYEVARRLGIEAEDYDLNTYDVVIETEGVKINVEQNMLAEVWFEPAVALPEGYGFGYDAKLEEVTKVAEYLKTEYADLMAFANPVMNIHGGDRNIYEEQGYDISFYDGSGSIVEQIINYNFNEATFYANEGMLSIIRMNQPDLSEKLGDYPIITAEEAKERLLKGDYITTVPYEVGGEELVAKVELVYRTSYLEEYFMPYYCFYVEVPEEAQGDMKTYGMYYVPAVRPEYLEGMSVWDGWFN